MYRETPLEIHSCSMLLRKSHELVKMKKEMALLIQSCQDAKSEDIETIRESMEELAGRIQETQNIVNSLIDPKHSIYL